MRLGVAAAVVGEEVVPGDVTVHNGRITSVGVAPAGRNGLAVPGFVDLQVNGVERVDLLSADAAGYAAVGGALAATGVTSYLAAFVTSPEAVLVRALVALAALPACAPRIIGAHLEGPFVSPARAGAHDPSALAAPDAAFAERLCDAGPVRLVTVAPELPVAASVIAEFRRRGAAISYGHTQAVSADGADAVTHLYNAMPAALARAALNGSAVVVQLIADGVHVTPDRVVAAFAAAPGRCAIVTDRVSTSGLGGRPVVAGNDAVRLPDGRLAGSILTMDAGVRNAVDWGVPVAAAVAAASTVPARLLGVRHALRPDSPADVAVLDASFAVRRTLVAGTEVWAT